MAAHGTLARYNHGPCRCERCTRACRDYHHRRRRERRRGPMPADVEHGKASTYKNWWCRCVPCTTANADALRAWRATRR